MCSTLFLSIVLLFIGDRPFVVVVPALYLVGYGEFKDDNLMFSTLIGDGAT